MSRVLAAALAVPMLFGPGACRAAGTAPFEAVEAEARPLDLDILGGGRFVLDHSAGRPIVLHFFATWCAPCVPELASLEALHRRLGDRVTIVAVDVAEVDARVARFFAERPVGFPVLMDRDRRAARAWGVDALPTSYLLDRSGRPVLVVRNDIDWISETVEARLDALSRDNGP